jgi:hypothetical protein
VCNLCALIYGPLLQYKRFLLADGSLHH